LPSVRHDCAIALPLRFVLACAYCNSFGIVSP
jgi:hypothetical protein